MNVTTSTLANPPRTRTVTRFESPALDEVTRELDDGKKETYESVSFSSGAKAVEHGGAVLVSYGHETRELEHGRITASKNSVLVADKQNVLQVFEDGTLCLFQDTAPGGDANQKLRIKDGQVLGTFNIGEANFVPVEGVVTRDGRLLVHDILRPGSREIEIEPFLELGWFVAQ